MLVYIIPSKLTSFGLQPVGFPEQKNFTSEDREPYELLGVPNVGHRITGYGKVVNVEWDLKTKEIDIYCVKPEHDLTDRYEKNGR